MLGAALMVGGIALLFSYYKPKMRRDVYLAAGGTALARSSSSAFYDRRRRRGESPCLLNYAASTFKNFPASASAIRARVLSRP